MDGLREGVHLRAHGQKDPLVEYKNEAFVLFGELMQNIKFEVLNNLFRSTTNLQQFEQFLQSLPQPSLSASNEPKPAPRRQRPPHTGPARRPDASALRRQATTANRSPRKARNSACR